MGHFLVSLTIGSYRLARIVDWCYISSEAIGRCGVTYVDWQRYLMIEYFHYDIVAFTSPSRLICRFQLWSYISSFYLKISLSCSWDDPFLARSSYRYKHCQKDLIQGLNHSLGMQYLEVFSSISNQRSLFCFVACSYRRATSWFFDLCQFCGNL